MIGKHMKGQSFSRCLHYVIEKPGARVIGGNLLSAEPESANAQLQAISKRSQRTTKPLLHCALSLAPGEHLSEMQWRQLTRQYLDAMGLGRNQYLLVRHTDTPNHEHVHLVINRVGFLGRSVSDSWDFVRSQAVIHRLEAQYGLTHAPLKRQKRSAIKTDSAAEIPLIELPASVQQHVALQRQLRSILNTHLSTATNLNNLTQQLREQHVQVHLLHRQGKAAGIAFEFGRERFSGSRLGQAYSLPKLLAAIAEAQHQVRADDAVSQFEPDIVLPHFHRRYLEWEAFVRQQLGAQASCREVDLAISKLALQSKSPEEGRSLIYSPDIQALRDQQGDDAAQTYLRELMQEAQKQLDKASVPAFPLQPKSSINPGEMYRE